MPMFLICILNNSHLFNKSLIIASLGPGTVPGTGNAVVGWKGIVM